jgi:hypothetical protein
MAKQKDRHLDAPSEANRDKHINFLAEENGDVDPADDNSTNKEDEEPGEGDDNGFFTDDDNQLQTKEEYEEDKSNKPGRNEKVTPLEYDDTQTLADKISVNSNNNDLVTLVVDNDNNPTENENDQPR